MPSTGLFLLSAGTSEAGKFGEVVSLLSNLCDVFLMPEGSRILDVSPDCAELSP